MEVVAELWQAMAITGKVVVVVLVAMSIYSYAVMIDRVIALRWVRRRSSSFAQQTEDVLERLSIEQTLEKTSEPESRPFCSLASVVETALREFKILLGEGQQAPLIMEGVDDVTSRSIDVAASNLRTRLTGLATIGAVGPFLGLFGTVTGLIAAFRDIAATGSGGIATVSGGISEALVTTVMGLWVAIPALWAYNYFMNRLDIYSLELDNKAARIVGHLVRRELLKVTGRAADAS